MKKIAAAVKTKGVPLSAHIDPAGNYLYVTLEGKKELQRFFIDQTTGKLEPRQEVALGFYPEDMAISREFR